MAKYRHERVEKLITSSIADLIIRDEIRDPRVSTLVSVTMVKLAKDLSHALVLVSGYLPDEQLTAAVNGLNHAAGFIQGHISRQLRLRVTPHLTFREDHSVKEGFEVIQQMKELEP